MTERIYYDDAYIKEFSARVVSCSESERGYIVELDRTAFFPEQGGQYSDRGSLSDAFVSEAFEEDGIIYHRTDKPLVVGKTVVGILDFSERYEKMQCHTAEHILSGLIHKHYGLDNVGFHLGQEDVTMDVSAPLSWEQLMKIEALANEAVYSNTEVEQIYPSADSLPFIEYRSKLDITENVRIIKIGEYDSCACCAPHVLRTGEIGLIMILDAEKLRGGMRIHIAAGKRAYSIYRKMYDNLSGISHTLSVPRLECAQMVRKLADDLEEKRSEYKAARLAFFEREADLLSETDGNFVFRFENATQDEMRSFANKAVEKIGGILVILSGNDGEYKYILASKSVDLKNEIKKINTALLGRGGGSSVMAQGSFGAAISEIKKYFT